MTTLTYTESLEIHQCPNCGVTHAIPKNLERQALENRGEGGRSIFCPNGHQWHFAGKTDAQKAREKAAQLEKQLANERESSKWAYDSLRTERAEHKSTQNKLNGTKGALTKAKKRAEAAVCPACNRSFVQMRRHLAAKHPELVQ